MLQDEGDGGRIQARVERVQDSARHGYGVVSFEQGRSVGGKYRHALTLPDPALHEGRGETAATILELAVSQAGLPMHHGCLVRVDRRGAEKEGDWRKRHIVRRALFQVALEDVGTLACRHVSSSLPAYCPTAGRVHWLLRLRLRR